MIRKAKLSDLDQLLELEEQLFTSSWKREHFEYELLENPFSQMYCYVFEEDVVAYVGFWITFETAQITTIGVKKEFQGKGIGSKLLKYVIAIARNENCELITLEVRVSNLPALELYKKEGFKINHIKEKYYNDNGEDAYYMIKSL